MITSDPLLGSLPPAGRQPPADRRPERRGGHGRHRRGHRQPRRPVPARGLHQRRAGARFYVLDGTPEDHPQAGVLGRFATSLPQGIKVGGWRDAAQFLAAVAGELALRQQPDASEAPELFLFVHDLARFRDLRRREDDFGFGRKEDDLAPPDHLDMILREGPGLGVHLIAWCDTVNNLNRYFTNQQLREFEMRVLFQMSPTDSGGLLDSPAASKLGRNRALFASEKQNWLEKFRPYGVPSEQWIKEVGDGLRRRTLA